MTPLSTEFRQNSLITKFNELKLFTGVKTVGGGTFYDCSKLSEVDFYNITRISNTATLASVIYAGCNKLTHAYFPNLKRISQWAFSSNTGNSLANPEIIVVGASWTTIDSTAALQYVSTKKIFFYTKTPPTLSGALASSGTTNTQYYVPDDSYDDYYSSSAWANLKSKLRKLSTYTGEKPWETLYPEELGLV